MQERTKKTIVYLNSFFYAMIIFLVVGKLILDLLSLRYQQSLLYYALLGIMTLLTLIVMTGLINKKEWARFFSIFLNLGIGFLLTCLNIILFFLGGYDPQNSENYLSFFDLETIAQMVVGIILFFLSLVFCSKHMKEYFK